MSAHGPFATVFFQLAKAWHPDASRSSGTVRRVYPPRLAQLLASESRDRSPGDRQALFAVLTERIARCVRSTDPAVALSGVLAIDELVDSEAIGDRATALTQLAELLQTPLECKGQQAIVSQAAATLGKLVLVGGGMTADVVEQTVQRALENLRPEKSPALRVASALVLSEMARNSPAVFNVHVRSFIEHIWHVLRDESRALRYVGMEALRECLRVVEKRETRYRVQWYYRLFEETTRGLQERSAPAVIHGSLLAMGEMLRHTGEFMLARYREVVSNVLRFKDHPDADVRLQVNFLLPKLAMFSPERFCMSYLAVAEAHLRISLYRPAERATGFEALAQIALAIAGTTHGATHLSRHMGEIAQAIHETLMDAAAVRAEMKEVNIEAMGRGLAQAAKSRRNSQVHVEGGSGSGRGMMEGGSGSGSGNGSRRHLGHLNLGGRSAPGGDHDLNHPLAHLGASPPERPGAPAPMSTATVGRRSSTVTAMLLDDLHTVDELKSLEADRVIEAAEAAASSSATSSAAGHMLFRSSSGTWNDEQEFTRISGGALRSTKGRLHALQLRGADDAVACAGAYAVAIGAPWSQHLAPLVPTLVEAGLSPGLIETLTRVVQAIPSLTPLIQASLKDAVAEILFRESFDRVVEGSSEGGGDDGEPGPALLENGEGHSGAPNGTMSCAGMAHGSAGERGDDISSLSRMMAKGTSNSPHTGSSDLFSGHEPTRIPMIRLALETFGTFRFGSASALRMDWHQLLIFTGKICRRFLWHPDPEVREVAAVAVARSTQMHAAEMTRDAKALRIDEADATAEIAAVRLVLQKRRRTIENTVLHLIQVAVSDESTEVRVSLLRELKTATHLWGSMAHPEALRCLFVGLNDEDIRVRELTLRIVGSLTTTNPAYTLPPLRRHLMVLLSDMAHSPTVAMQVEAVTLLASLLASVPPLALAYITPIATALADTLDSTTDAVLSSKSNHQAPLLTMLLETVAQLATVAGSTITPWAGRFMSAAIRCFEDASGILKRHISAATLGALSKHCFQAMSSYERHPRLMTLLLRFLHEGDPRTRHEVIRTIGILGALDPYAHKIHQAAVSGEIRLEEEGVRAIDPSDAIKMFIRPKGDEGGVPGAPAPVGAGGGGGGPHTKTASHAAAAGAKGATSDRSKRTGTQDKRNYHHAGVVQPALPYQGGQETGDLVSVVGMLTASPDYYPAVAVNALVRVLCDRAMASHRHQAVASLMYIFKAMPTHCISLLPKVLPTLLDIARMSGDAPLREQILHQLPLLVGIVKQHARKHMVAFMACVDEFWTPGSPHIPTLLDLLHQLCTVANEDVGRFIPSVLPKLIGVLHEASRSGDFTNTVGTLKVASALGSSLEHFLHILLPAVSALFSPDTQAPDVTISAALRCYRTVLPQISLAGYFSGAIHPLLRGVVETNAFSSRIRLEMLMTIHALVRAVERESALFAPAIHMTFQRVRASPLTTAQEEEVMDRILREPVLSRGVRGGGRDLVLKQGTRGEAAAAAGTSTTSASPPLFEDSELPDLPVTPSIPAPPLGPLTVNEIHLRRAWASSDRSTKEDWIEWLRNFAVELLRESPSPALRACHALAQAHPSMARDLFISAFVSCWSELPAPVQAQLVRSLEAALASPSIPPEIVTSLLNLAEFMEHDEKSLPLDPRTLGVLAEKCHAFAKALHYKELEFESNPTSVVEGLISINNHLHHPDAAIGMLEYARKDLDMHLKDNWYEKLQRWEEALHAYERRIASGRLVPGSAPFLEAILGRLRCLAALGEWEELARCCRDVWAAGVEPFIRREVAMLGAYASWNTAQWGDMADYTHVIQGKGNQGTGSTGLFLAAVVATKRHDFQQALRLVDNAREALGTDLAALIGESYDRAYGDVVRLQQMEELEEVIEYLQLSETNPTLAVERKGSLQRVWSQRLQGVQRNVDVWHAILAVRSLVWPNTEEPGTWIKFAALCRKSGRLRQATNTLQRLLDADLPEGQRPRVRFAWLKHLWSTGQRDVAFREMAVLRQDLVLEGSMTSAAAAQVTGGGTRSPTIHASVSALVPSPQFRHGPTGGGADYGRPPTPVSTSTNITSAGGATNADSDFVGLEGDLEGLETDAEQWEPSLLSKVSIRLGLWRWNRSQDALDETALEDILKLLHQGARDSPHWGKAWHHWALFNVAALNHTLARYGGTPPSPVGPPGGVGGGRISPLSTLSTPGSRRSSQDHAEDERGALGDLGTGGGGPGRDGGGGGLRTSQLGDDQYDQYPGMGHAYSHGRHRASGMGGDSEDPATHVATFITSAIRGFFRSIAMGQRTSKSKTYTYKNKSGGAADAGTLQDLLRLLTLWFTHGSIPEVQEELQAGFAAVRIETWLGVIPQIIARIHSNLDPVKHLIHLLLVRIGSRHPQAVMYPLIVSRKSSSPARSLAANAVMDQLRQQHGRLLAQGRMVSNELIRMAILWHEMWHEALEEASRLYFGEGNIPGMLQTLLPLHELMQPSHEGGGGGGGSATSLLSTGGSNVASINVSPLRLDTLGSGPTTPMELAFVHQYGADLREAHSWCTKYQRSRRESDLHQAWDLYYHVFKRICKQLPSLMSLDVARISPTLLHAQDLDTAVPGTYTAGNPLVRIASFGTQLQVISSKQRPRKLAVAGSDGAYYMFLLKGHEDLRQDERVMQLFRLVNQLLASERLTQQQSLSVARYAVIPLSPNSGLIGWVPNCDTMHALIREYRDARRMALNLEHRIMLSMAPDYDHLTIIQKVEAFEHALENTPGDDLRRVLWFKSRTSETWLERRTCFSRSLAVMSMVGYLLGLGDRHPSNLMIDRYSGKLLHIDFGDCFEASMHREKFPERVPFRLTRMLTKSMGVSGIEGNFRITAEKTMKVLRMNKDSVMAMLEAFVHDPLINWRLLDQTAITDAQKEKEGGGGGDGGDDGGDGGAGGGGAGEGGDGEGRVGGGAGGDGEVGDRTPNASPGLGRATTSNKENPEAPAINANEALNERAVVVMDRMTDKLTGRDFHVEGTGGDPARAPDSVSTQVANIIAQATNNENLCQAYIGWCPFW